MYNYLYLKCKYFKYINKIGINFDSKQINLFTEKSKHVLNFWPLYSLCYNTCKLFIHGVKQMETKNLLYLPRKIMVLKSF